MDKTVIVQVVVPAAGRSYDIKIPLGSRMAEITRLVAAAVSDLEQGVYTAAKEAVLCSRPDGAVININLSAAEAGLQNGSVLILI